MIYKIVLIAALCVAQAFAFQPSNSISQLEQEEILHEETENIQGYNPEVVKACFRRQKEPYARLGKEIAGMVDNASDEMAKILGEKYPKYARKATTPLKTIEKTLGELPQKMWILITVNQFEKSVQVAKQSRKTVEENSRVITQILREMADESADAATKGGKMAREIREVSKNGYNKIEQEFYLCVTRGKNQIPADGDSNVEETPLL